MKSSVERKKDTELALSVTIEKEQITKELDRIFKDLKKNVVIPGFRRGKVPKKIIEARIGMDGIKAEAQQNLIPQALHEALTINDIDPVSVDVTKTDWNDTESLLVEAIVEIMAPFTVDNYKDLEAKEITYNITDRNINFYLDQFASRFAERKEQEDSYEIKENDFVSVTFTADTEDAVPVKKIVQVGKKELPELEVIILGMKKSEEKAVKEKIFNPESISEDKDNSINGKIKINMVECLVNPELTDELIEKNTEHKTVDEFKNDIRENLEKDFARLSNNRVREELLKQIIDSTKFEIPEPIIERTAEIKSKEFMQMLSQKGISPEAFMSLGEEERKSFNERFKGDAQNELKLQYTLKQIAQQEGFEISEEELTTHIEEMAKKENQNLEKMKILFSDDSRRTELKKSLLFEKTLNAVVGFGKIEKTTEDAPLPGEENKIQTEKIEEKENQAE